MPSSRLDRSSAGAEQRARREWGRLEQQAYWLVERGLEVLARKWSSLHRPNLSVPPGGGEGSGAATMADVRACYRLLLQRAPDAAGLVHYRARVSQGLSASRLVEEFIGSVEYTHAHVRPGRPERVPSELVLTSEGFRMHVDPTDYAVGHTVARTSTYEPAVTAAIRGALQPGDTFVDLGANIGWFSLLGAMSVGPTGRVVAVEPNPLNAALLRDSAKENGFDNIDVLPVAVADRAGAVALETDGSNGRVIPIDGPPAEAFSASFVVASYPLDTLLHDTGMGRVDVMKIDVEGAEPIVLRGAAGTISRDRPVIISEFYPLALECAPWGSPEAYLADLRDLGYSLSVIGHRGDHDDAAIMSLASGPGHDHVDILALPL